MTCSLLHSFIAQKNYPVDFETYHEIYKKNQDFLWTISKFSRRDVTRRSKSLGPDPTSVTSPTRANCPPRPRCPPRRKCPRPARSSNGPGHCIFCLCGISGHFLAELAHSWRNEFNSWPWYKEDWNFLVYTGLMIAHIHSVKSKWALQT